MTCLDYSLSSLLVRTNAGDGLFIAGQLLPEAAGEIHTDLQKGFIRAEVVAYNDLVALGSMNEAKSKGKFRLEGKEIYRPGWGYPEYPV